MTFECAHACRAALMRTMIACRGSRCSAKPQREADWAPPCTPSVGFNAGQTQIELNEATERTAFMRRWMAPWCRSPAGAAPQGGRLPGARAHSIASAAQAALLAPLQLAARPLLLPFQLGPPHPTFGRLESKVGCLQVHWSPASCRPGCSGAAAGCRPQRRRQGGGRGRFGCR